MNRDVLIKRNEPLFCKIEGVALTKRRTKRSFLSTMSVTVDLADPSVLHLRIQLPEELEYIWKEKAKRGREEKKGGRQEEEEGREEEEETERQGKEGTDSCTEYVAASPRFTWTDEHVRCVKQEKFGERLWPVVLRSYGVTEENVSLKRGSYRAFLSSPYYLHSERYSHHSLRGLMEWYVEENVDGLRRDGMSAEEKEVVKRRKLLRSLFLQRNLTWSGDYLEVYQVWARENGVGMNRYRKMVTFLETFFDA